MRRLVGTVSAVTRRVLGTTLAADLSLGDTSIQVLSASALPESGSLLLGFSSDNTTGPLVGGSLSLDYTAVALAQDTGAAFDVLTLSEASTVSASADTPLFVDPAQVTYVALVSVAGEPPVEAVVRHRLVDATALAVSSSGLSTTVEVEEDEHGALTVVDVLGTDLQADLSKAAPASLKPSVAVDSSDIADSNVVADWLNLTNVTAVTLTGATIQTATPDEGGRRTWMDADGLHQTSAGGVPRMDFPNEQGGTNFLKGALDADSLEVNGAAVMRDELDISPGGKIVLETALSAPASPPTMLVDWQTLTTDSQGLGSGKYRVGLVFDSGAWWTASFDPARGSTTLWSIDPVSGVSTSQFVFAVQGPSLGLTRLGTDWFLLWVDSRARWHVVEADDTGATVADWIVPRGSFASQPVLGTDGTNLLVAGLDESGNVLVLTYDTTGTLLSSTTLYPVTGFALRSVAYGSFDFGEDVWVVSSVGADKRVLVARSGGSDWDDSFSWPLAFGDTDIGGLWWDGTAFSTIDADNPKIYTYTDALKTSTGDDLTLWLSGAWYQTTNGYHTKISPTAKLAMSKRARIQASGGNLPGSGGADDPDSFQVFIGQGASDPGASGAYLNCTSDVGTADCIITSPVFTGTTGYTTNTFPAGSPAELDAADGTALIKADKTGYIFDLIAAGGGGGGTGGVDIDCGNATATGVDIDCGSAA